jgi:hypothetical protein
MANLTVAFEDRRSYLGAIEDNAAANARLTLTFDSAGSGEFSTKYPIPFQTTFTAEPTVSTGVAFLGGKPVPGYFPNVGAGVWHWQRDAKGYYVGAWLFFVVDINDPGGATTSALHAARTYKLRHHLTFEGVIVRLYGQAASGAF